MITDVLLQDPQFDRAGKVHDWRNHVGERTQAMWSTFSYTQRSAIALDAEDRAAAEEWD